jgi:hypothetical protein
MVNRFLDVASIFNKFSQRLQPALFCMQFADSASNIAAGALIQTRTLSLFFLRIVLLFFRVIIKGKGPFHVTATCQDLSYNF